jgi:hypothetical protein
LQPVSVLPRFFLSTFTSFLTFLPLSFGALIQYWLGCRYYYRSFVGPDEVLFGFAVKKGNAKWKPTQTEYQPTQSGS